MHANVYSKKLTKMAYTAAWKQPEPTDTFNRRSELILVDTIYMNNRLVK